MRKQVCYLMSGQAHLPYLVCSLYTLREQWDGEICVYAWPESFDLVQEIAKDKRLVIQCRKREPELRKKDGVGGNSQFIDKIRMVQDLAGEVGTVLYLDADTTVHHSIAPLLSLVEYHEFSFVATQFSGWTTASSMIRRRLQSLLETDLAKQVDAMQCLSIIVNSSEVFPSVNGGVFAARPTSPVLSKWHEWTLLAGGQFISDEKVLHLLQDHFRAGVMMTICDGGRWNCSAKLQPKQLSDNEVVIYHYHGDSNVRPKKSQRAVDLWWPIYQTCVRENIGGIQGWRGQVKNRWLDQLE